MVRCARRRTRAAGGMLLGSVGFVGSGRSARSEGGGGHVATSRRRRRVSGGRSSTRKMLTMYGPNPSRRDAGAVRRVVEAGGVRSREGVATVTTGQRMGKRSTRGGGTGNEMRPEDKGSRINRTGSLFSGRVEAGRGEGVGDARGKNWKSGVNEASASARSEFEREEGRSGKKVQKREERGAHSMGHRREEYRRSATLRCVHQWPHVPENGQNGQNGQRLWPALGTGMAPRANGGNARARANQAAALPRRVLRTLCWGGFWGEGGGEETSRERENWREWEGGERAGGG